MPNQTFHANVRATRCDSDNASNRRDLASLGRRLCAKLMKVALCGWFFQPFDANSDTLLGAANLAWTIPSHAIAAKKQFWIERTMAEGTIKRLTDKGFGFIDVGAAKDLFFHSSSVEGTTYDELREGQQVTFNEVRGEKGPCAENVQVAG